MNYGLPIITTDFLENGEKVENYYNGFKIPLGNNFPIFQVPYVPVHFGTRSRPAIDREFIQKLCDKIQYLYENESERLKMGKNSRKLVKERYSLESKNKILKSIYDGI